MKILVSIDQPENRRGWRGLPELSEAVVSLAKWATLGDLLERVKSLLGISFGSLEDFNCSVVQLGRDVQVINDRNPETSLSDLGVVPRSTFFISNRRVYEGDRNISKQKVKTKITSKSRFGKGFCARD